MFADDTFALQSDHDIEKLITELNKDINKMAVWFKANKLAVNKTKTKYIIFHSKGKKIPENLNSIHFDENEPGLPFDQNKITVLEKYHDNHIDKSCRAYKLLGVYLDEHLSLDFHTRHIANKLTKSMYCIKMAKNNLNYKGLRSLYFALIHSHLSYCPVILSTLSASNQKILFKVQKKAIRIMTGSNYNDHTGPLFFQHKILPLNQLLKQGKLIFMHSIYYGYAPKSFSNTWRKNNDRPGDLNLSLRNDNLFCIPAPRVEFFKRIPLYSLPHEWNRSENLMFYDNLFTFKNVLREILLQEITE